MTITDIMFTPEQFKAFFTYFKDEPQQAEGVELLYNAIAQSDPALLTDTAEWVQAYRTAPPAPARFTPDAPFDHQVTPHIQYGEIALWSENRRFKFQSQCDIALELCRFLETARAHFGGTPIIITSGYRPPSVNAAVGGSPQSEHLYDRADTGAIDWYLKHVNIYTLQEWCLSNWPYSTGKGAPMGFVHTGMRTGRPRVSWTY